MQLITTKKLKYKTWRDNSTYTRVISVTYGVDTFSISYSAKSDKGLMDYKRHKKIIKNTIDSLNYLKQTNTEIYNNTINTLKNSIKALAVYTTNGNMNKLIKILLYQHTL